MSRSKAFSPQTLMVLRLLHDDPQAWWHGYDIARRTGLKSGTLYPILARLAERGLLDAQWEEEQPAGRPRRHRYRLTDEGVQQSGCAVTADAAAAQPQRRPGLAWGGA
jgi:DNA-binding PadR family transcriptional regulator